MVRFAHYIGRVEVEQDLDPGGDLVGQVYESAAAGHRHQNGGRSTRVVEHEGIVLARRRPDQRRPFSLAQGCTSPFILKQ